MPQNKPSMSLQCGMSRHGGGSIIYASAKVDWWKGSTFAVVTKKTKYCEDECI